jgi:Ca-activated chloride channel family protein
MRRISRILVATVALSLSTSAVPQASQVALSVAVSNPVLKSDQKQTAFLKVGLEGFRMPVTSKRVAVNVALVLDKSGSMNGRKIEEAKQAAIQAIRRLDANDIVSVVVYDSTVEVLVPATKLTDKDFVCKKIAQIQPGGRTALFAGVSKAAAELRKFIDRERVNRIVLLSDGLANIGPRAPSELGSLGASLKKENISVTAMGLGLDYNEDLMVQLAATAAATTSSSRMQLKSQPTSPRSSTRFCPSLHRKWPSPSKWRKACVRFACSAIRQKSTVRKSLRR